jgi:hypothetical protein
VPDLSCIPLTRILANIVSRLDELLMACIMRIRVLDLAAMLKCIARVLGLDVT